MRDTRKIKSLVKRILLEDKDCRDNDNLLYLRVISELTPEFTEQPLHRALRNPLIPKRDSVTRARRWVQAHIEGTQADSKVQAKRELEEEKYKEVFANGR